MLAVGAVRPLASAAGRPGREVTVDRSVIRGVNVMPRRLVWMASAAGLLAVTVLSLAGPPVQAEPTAYPVSATGPNSVHASFTAWLAMPAGRSFAAQNGTASQKPLPAAAVRPVPRAAAPDVRRAGRKSPVLGRIVLIAVVLAAAGAFAVLQVRSRRRSPATGNRRLGAVYDWRTLPPKYENEPADDEWPFADQEGYGPLWRYGAPRGSGRDYDPGPDPGYGPDRRLPWGFPDDAPHEGWP
jgi:hypothetical protein